MNEFDSIGAMFEEIFREFGVAGVSGIVTVSAVFILELILDSKGLILHNGQKRLEAAEREGRMLTADRIRLDKPDHYKDIDWYYAVYEYYVNGKRKTKVISRTRTCPPETITLYYISSPAKKVYTYGELTNEPLRPLFTILPFAAGALVMWLIGGAPSAP